MSIITTERALQVHAVVGTLFSAPFLVKGAAEFGSMLVDGAVKPDAISKIPSSCISSTWTSSRTS